MWSPQPGGAESLHDGRHLMICWVQWRRQGSERRRRQASIRLNKFLSGLTPPIPRKIGPTSLSASSPLLAWAPLHHWPQGAW